MENILEWPRDRCKYKHSQNEEDNDLRKQQEKLKEAISGNYSWVT